MAEKEPIVLRRLLMAKMFYKRGVVLGQIPSQLEHMIAIHHLHLAVEITLRALAISLDIAIGQKDALNFPDLIKQIDKSLKLQNRALPYRSQIMKLNERRNWVQHHAETVSIDFLNEAQVHTLDFLSEVFGQYLSVDFADLDEYDFVEDSKLKEVIRMARQLSQKTVNCGIALVCLEIAFKAALKSWSRKIQLFALGPYADAEECSSLDYLEDILLLHFSGINPFEYDRFRRKNPSVKMAMAGNFEVDFMHDDESYAKEIEFKIDFVVKSILTWQQRNLNPQFIAPDKTIDQLRQWFNKAIGG